jgi:hypothetical protein
MGASDPKRRAAGAGKPRFLTKAETAALLDELSRAVDGTDVDAAAGAGVTEALVAAMEAVGIHPAFVHAFRQTGMLVSEDNQDLWTPAELQRWEAALEDHGRPAPSLRELRSLAHAGRRGDWAPQN